MGHGGLPTDGGLDFAVLGPLEVRRDGTLLVLAAARRRALLARLLVSANEVISSDTLIEDLWPTDPPENPVNALQAYLSHLRAALGCGRAQPDRNGTVVTRKPGYLLSVDADHLDSLRFEHLAAEGRAALAADRFEEASRICREGLALWRGPALAEFHDEAWARPVAARLEDLRWSVLEDRLDADLALGHHGGLIGEIEAAVSRQPLRERLHGQLILALYRAGRQADALRAYQQVRTTLGEELGIEPGPALRELEGAILLQKPELDPLPRSTRIPVPGPAEPALRSGRGGATRDSVLASRVVGRDVEISALDDAFARAAGGQGGVVFLVGEPGIGKSRLAEVAASTAQSSALPVLRGRAVPTSSPLPYRPLAEALCSAVRRGAVSDAPELGPFRSILGRLVPEWAGDETRVVDSVMALAEAVLRLLRVVAGDRGCLVVLEDLHWADPETLGIVEYLADNLGSERVLCLATLRDEERSTGLELAHALQARRASKLLHLSRLDQDDVAKMLASCLGASVADEVLGLAARADGVPFLVEELLAVAVASGALVDHGGSWTLSKSVDRVVPLTFSDSMRRRLGTLGEQARTVLLAAAVLGRRFDWSLLPQIAESNEDEVLEALHAAVDAQIVAVDPDEATFSFRHALSRDAVVAELLPPERTALSRRALEAVEAAHPELEEAWCELAAELAEAAGERHHAGELLLQAGRRSLQRGALASAEATLDRAHSLLTPDDTSVLDVEECLSQVLSLAGKHDRAVEVGNSLLARLAPDEGGTKRRAEVYLRLARAAVAATHWKEADELLQHAQTEIAAAPEEPLSARVNAVRAQISIMREPEEAPRLAQAALEVAERLGLADVVCEALEVLGRSKRRHDLEAAEAVFSRALAVAEAHGLIVWRARALHELGTIDMLRGRPVRRLEEARALAVAQGAMATAAVVDVQIAAALAFRDDPEPAIIAAHRSAGLSRRYGLSQTLAAAVALEAHVHARAGRREEMQRCIKDAQAQAPGVPDVEIKTSLAAAMLAFVEEDGPRLRHHLYRAVVPASIGPGGDYSAAPGAGMLALVRQLDGTDDEAAEARVAKNSVHFVTRAFLRYSQAVAAGRAGHSERAVGLVAEGDQILGDHRWLRYLGWRLVAEAAVAHGWGHPVPWLREALGFFDGRGEERIASACRSMLRRAGAAVPRRRGEENVPGPLRAQGVTSRELEVLRLLAAGLANREIGERLYLSPRTVERHVANLSVKTGVGRRSELVAYAARTVVEAPPP